MFNESLKNKIIQAFGTTGMLVWWIIELAILFSPFYFLPLNPLVSIILAVAISASSFTVPGFIAEAVVWIVSSIMIRSFSLVVIFWGIGYLVFCKYKLIPFFFAIVGSIRVRKKKPGILYSFLDLIIGFLMVIATIVLLVLLTLFQVAIESSLGMVGWLEALIMWIPVYKLYTDVWNGWKQVREDRRELNFEEEIDKDSAEEKAQEVQEQKDESRNIVIDQEIKYKEVDEKRKRRAATIKKKIKRRDVAITALAILLFFSIAFSSYQFFSVEERIRESKDAGYAEGYAAAEENLERVEASLKAANEKVKNLETRNDKLSKKLEYYYYHAGIVSGNGKYYHRYGCEDANFEHFYIYNIELASTKGYDPCPNCFNNVWSYLSLR